MFANQVKMVKQYFLKKNEKYSDFAKKIYFVKSTMQGLIKEDLLN